VGEFSLPGCQVMRIIEDDQHNLWIGGVLDAHAFVAVLDHTEDKWTTYPLYPSTDAIYTMLQASDDEFWLGTRLNGLFKWNRRTSDLENFLHDPGQANSLPGNYIEDILKGPGESIWIATRSGLCNYDNRTSQFRNFVFRPDGKGPPSNSIMDICTDGAYLWIATENGGLSRMDTGNETFSNFQFDKNDPKSLINNSIWSLHRDHQGRIWIGSYAKGLCVLDFNEEKFSVVDVPAESSLVNAVLKDSRGRFWIGTEEGLIRYDKNGVHHYRHDARKKTTLSSNAINCLFEDSKHRIWTGHWNGGICRFNEQEETFTRYLPDPARAGAITNANVFGIAESSLTGELLVASFGGLQVLKDPERGIFQVVGDYPREGDQLLLTVYEDSAKKLWVGAYSGLGLVDMSTNSIKRFNLSGDTAQANDRVNCILEDRHKRLWVGSFGGLHQMVDKDSFTTYTTDDGLPVNLVQGILEDTKGNLWLGTSHGLTSFDPLTKVFKTYDESDGLLSSEFRRQAFFDSGDGRLYAGGNGLNVFYPDSIQSNPYPPPVFITDLKILNQSVRPREPNGVLTDAILETREITLDYKHTFITLHYVGLNYTASHKNQYAYKLEGFDNDWNYVGNQRFATFTNLNPGTYTFRVKASNNDGLWNEDGASLIIHVLPPWWGTVWFRTLMIGLIAGLATTLYYYRVNGIRRQNIRLEELVRARTQELLEKNDVLAVREKEIKTQNERLIQSQEETSTQRDQLAAQNKLLEEASKTIERKNLEILRHNETLERTVVKRTKDLLDHNHQLEQFAFISAHNLRSPVARILGLGEILGLASSDQEKEMILEKLVHTTRELDNVVRDLNKILDIRHNHTSVITEIELTQEMALVRTTLQREIDYTGAQIIEDFSRVATVHSVKPYVDSILMNLVSNAIKYRNPERTPLITVSAEPCGEFVRITVSDNGLGIDLPKYEDKLFKLYGRFHSHVEGKGIGLYLVKTQVAALGGSIEAIANADCGMTFLVSLPIKISTVVPT
jgi:ligand-binding sensor domain-containing protein/signal transduction histidine kinase